MDDLNSRNLNEAIKEIKKHQGDIGVLNIVPDTLLIPKHLVDYLGERGYKTNDDILKLVKSIIG